MLLVATSRVTHRDNLRIMPLRAGSTLAYLKALKPDPKLVTWLSGFNGEGVWSANAVVAHLARNKPAAKTPTAGGPNKKAEKKVETKATKMKRPAPAEPEEIPRKKARTTKKTEEPVLPTRLPQEQQIVQQLPATLLHSWQWAANSCPLDAFLESVYSCAIAAPVILETEREMLTTENIEPLFRHLNDPTECLLHLLSFRHRHQGDNRAVKTTAWRVLHQLCGDPLRPPGVFGAAMDWLQVFADQSPSNLLSHTFTLKTTCPEHGPLQTSRQVPLISVSRDDLKKGLENWRESIDRPGPCFAPCVQRCENVVSEVQSPTVLVVESNRDIQMAQVEHLGSRYEPRAALRHKTDHFVAYVKHGEEWFLHDGYIRPSVTPVLNIRSSADFRHHPVLFFFVKV